MRMGDRSNRVIAFIVIGGHLFGLLLLSFKGKDSSQERKKIHIETVMLETPKIKRVTTKKAPVVQPIAASKPEKKILQPQKILEMPAPEPSKKKELLAATKKSLATLQATTPNKKDEISKEKLPTLSTELSQDVYNEPSYTDKLIAHLEEFLILPEKGSVKIELTLSPTGKVIKVAILSCLSQANRDYIYARLTSLTFPASCRKKESTFVLSLEGNAADL